MLCAIRYRPSVTGSPLAGPCCSLSEPRPQLSGGIKVRVLVTCKSAAMLNDSSVLVTQDSLRNLLPKGAPCCTLQDSCLTSLRKRMLTSQGSAAAALHSPHLVRLWKF